MSDQIAIKLSFVAESQEAIDELNNIVQQHSSQTFYEDKIHRSKSVEPVTLIAFCVTFLLLDPTASQVLVDIAQFMLDYKAKASKEATEGVFVKVDIGDVTVNGDNNQITINQTVNIFTPLNLNSDTIDQLKSCTPADLIQRKIPPTEDRT